MLNFIILCESKCYQDQTDYDSVNYDDKTLYFLKKEKKYGPQWNIVDDNDKYFLIMNGRYGYFKFYDTFEIVEVKADLLTLKNEEGDYLILKRVPRQIERALNKIELY